MTLFLHTKDFYYPKKMKTCLFFIFFFLQGQEEECVFNQKSRGLKSHLPPAWGHLHPGSTLRHTYTTLRSRRGSSWGRKSHPLGRAWQVLFPSPQCHRQSMIILSSKYKIHLTNAICAKKLKIFMSKQLFKNLLKTWQGIIQPFKWRLWNHMKNTQNVLQAQENEDSELHLWWQYT